MRRRGRMRSACRHGCRRCRFHMAAWCLRVAGRHVSCDAASHSFLREIPRCWLIGRRPVRRGWRCGTEWRLGRWRMQNLTYGFEHLEHRSRYFGNPDPPRVPFDNRLDLSAILQAKYGRDYVPNPRMINLAQQNGSLPQGFLTGEQEAEAFKNKDFIRMHASTLAKVDFFRHVIVLAQQGRLRTATKNWGVRIDRLLESKTAKIIALAAGVAGVVGAIVAIYHIVLWLKGAG